MWEEYKNADTSKSTLCCNRAFMHLETGTHSLFLTSVTITMDYVLGCEVIFPVV